MSGNGELVEELVLVPTLGVVEGAVLPPNLGGEHRVWAASHFGLAMSRPRYDGRTMSRRTSECRTRASCARTRRG